MGDRVECLPDVPKTSTFLFFEQVCEKLTDFNNFGMLNPEQIWLNTLQICPPHLSDEAALPCDIQKKSFFKGTCIDTDMLRLAVATFCDMGWLSAQRGVLRDWPVSKKTGSMY